MTWEGWKTKYLYGVVGFIIVGLIGVQVYWIMSSIRLQKVSVERKLKEDLSVVIRQLEEQAYCFTLNSKAFIKKGEGIYIVKQKWKYGQFFGTDSGELDTLNLYNVFYQDNDTFFMNDRSLSFENYSATVDVSLKFTLLGLDPEVTRDTGAYDIRNLSNENFRDVLSNRLKVNEALNMLVLDSLVKQVLVKNNLDTAYQAGIRKHGSTVYDYLKPGTNVSRLEQTPILISFAEQNRFNTPYEFLVYIPHSFVKIMMSLSVMMLSSVIIIVLLIISYAYFVRTILNQKKLSEMKNTIINNITHEFRTPITNIGLAVENWRELSTNSNFYFKIIEEENKHLERNVEQILQLATVDHPKIGKKLVHVNMHELINQTVAAFEIQLRNLNGSAVINFYENTPHFYADKFQLANMIHNLIDNAIKYRRDKPVVIISTYDVSGRYVIQIEDNGIGMSAETQRHMFDRFFRGHTGDRHDVKGFGLGLSYVKYIVDAHNGEIHVKSKEGKGTKFIIYLPKDL